MSTSRRRVSFTIEVTGDIAADDPASELDALELELQESARLALLGNVTDPRVTVTRAGELYPHTVYVVIPLGMLEEQATAADIAGVRLAMLPFTSHPITDPSLCADITARLMANLLNGV